MKTIRWGVLGCARIAARKVMPAMQKVAGHYIGAIASRDRGKARQFAGEFGIPVVLDSYKALLECADIDAVYIPLPNSLHVEWCEKALAHGKHVLCEKPLALSAREALRLKERAEAMPHLKLMEAFMYRFHPQWDTVESIIASGEIGVAKAVLGHFSYFNDNAADIRNQEALGGGGLYDIGCYISDACRLVFKEGPLSVHGCRLKHRSSGTDISTSATMLFSSGTAAFSCSTQALKSQRLHILGELGNLDIVEPFNQVQDSAEIVVRSAAGTRVIRHEPVDAYARMIEFFGQAVLNDVDLGNLLRYSIDNATTLENISRNSHAALQK